MSPAKKELKKKLKNDLRIKTMNINFYKRFRTPWFEGLVKTLKTEKKEIKRLLAQLG